MPLVSIGLPVYNGELSLREAIESILAQTFSDFELIISDNASTDKTESICKEYQLKDRRVKYYRNEENIGAAKNFNRVFELSSGKYFKWAAHDDVCEPTYLERCVKVLDNDPSAVLCHSKTVLIDEHGQRLSFDAAKKCFVDEKKNYFPDMDSSRNLDSAKAYERYAEILLATDWCFEIFGLIRSDALKKTKMQESFYGTDKVLLSELSLMGRFKEIQEPLFFRRCHLKQSTSIASASEREIWNNPDVQRGFLYPRIMCFWGYIRAIFRYKVKWYDKILCLIVLARWLTDINGWKSLLEDYFHGKNRISTLIG